MSNKCATHVKIDIIGGYLGAGKTTFMNKLLRDGLAAERVVIIENEFGEEPIDNDVLSSSGLEMRTLASGCICCTLKVDFISSIADIVGACHPDRILIEPTGLASPAELESTCEMATRVKGLDVDVHVNSMLAIVDATDAIEMLEYEIPVYMYQIQQARTIVLSHTQELATEELASVRAAIEAVARPDVVIVDAPWDTIDALEVLAISEHAYARSLQEDEATHEESAAEQGSHEDAAEDNGHGHEIHHHEARHHHHHGHEGFVSTVLRPCYPYDAEALEQLGDALRAQHVARAKGFLPSPEGGMLHYEFVNGRANTTPTEYASEAKLVVIGQDLDTEALNTLC